jgi:peptidoglycan/LPS O-acetylase OafA/YrhL
LADATRGTTSWAGEGAVREAPAGQQDCALDLCKTNQKPVTFRALNGLRFLAALYVVVFHYSTRVDVYPIVPVIIRNLIDEGPSAVSFFFILSGFVLAHRHLPTDSHFETASAFYWARFIRLYPTYLLSFLLFLPIAIQRYLLTSNGSRTFILSALLSCLMLQSWTPLAQAWNGPSWSLSVEAFMYFMFPLIGFGLARLPLRKTILVLFVLWLMPSGLAVAYVEHWIPGRTWHLYMTNNPLLWVPLFVMGICASRMVPAWMKIAPNKANILTTLAFIALMLAYLAWPHRFGDVLVTGGIAPLLVALILFSTRITGRITKLLGGTLLGKLGDASYAIYILQAPLWHCWQPLTNYARQVPLQTEVVNLWQFVAFIPFLVMTAFVVHRFIETPVRTWARKKNDMRSVIEDTEQTVKRQVLEPNRIGLLGEIKL